MRFWFTLAIIAFKRDTRPGALTSVRLGTPYALRLFMKRALRSCETEMFFKSDGRQTQRIEEAQSFEGFGDAVEFCRQHKLKQTELIFRTGRPEDDLRIKIDDASGSGKVVKWWVGQTPKADD
jgi:hypothetical protein